ncbi:hypothetical protein TWF106_003343 [Orbilia oligospora]|uniref:Rhodanese domain-containing protein n=1 Tax=Orbilia oligospora TaxID=2813651 RepID=A0A7C8USB5_ORBOL|nr:hypothetical protein TWF106_003343 [Orbilia oligospora]
MAKQATIITDRRTEEQTIFPGESETWSDWDSAEWEYNGCSPFVLSQPGTVLDKIYYSPNNPNQNPLRIYFESPKYGSFKAPNIQNLNRAKRILKLEDMEREEIPRFDPLIAQNLEDFLDQEARREFDMDPFDSILHEGLPKVDPSIGVNAWLLQAREKKEGYSIITEEQKDDRIQPEDASSETDIEIEEEEEEEVHLGQRVLSDGSPWHAAFPSPRTTKPGALTRKDVLELLQKEGTKDFVLVDLRRNDYEGGTIRGSINLPAQSLYPTIPTLYDLFKAGNVKQVIWYCEMKSVILEGGIKGWVKGGNEYTETMIGYAEEAWSK